MHADTDTDAARHRPTQTHRDTDRQTDRQTDTLKYTTHAHTHIVAAKHAYQINTVSPPAKRSSSSVMKEV
jgi:hypothetical protein